MLGVVDFATEQGGPCAVTLGVPEHVERIERGSRAAAENADDNGTVVSDKLFHGGGTKVRDFQEQRPPGICYSGQQPRDAVVHKPRNVGWTRFSAGVGRKHFQEMPEA